ncbi:Solute carrier family 2, facilitated glucose transporter member 3 [Hypsibius exemplaris]|uniref:Solute carrier family 2, facilitated glucose transporter member 3 n=1 Tax=Hypsibius exemplaris TaxID=2072580 RepID=A0A1W0X161_HYPEX|nr:Solute carrier family 2, facilitated glucose transporter member 3 [Hypsibius exemplaris]
MADQIAQTQTSILTLLGFQPSLANLAPSSSSKRGKILAEWARKTVSLAILCGSLTCMILTITQTILWILAMHNDQSTLLLLFGQSINFFTAARPFYVLAWAFHRTRPQFQRLRKTAEKFIQAVQHCQHKESDGPTISAGHRKASLWWFVITATWIVIWYVWYRKISWEWWHMVFWPASSNITSPYWTENSLHPLPIYISTWQLLVLACVFSVCPYILSQQVLGVLILHAALLKSGLKQVNMQIEETIKNYEYYSIRDLETRLQHWKRAVAISRDLCGVLNKYFSWILFGIYGLDFMTVFGFGTNIVMVPMPRLEYYAYYCVCVLLFGSNILVALTPLVFAHEQSVRISANIQCLIDRIESDAMANNIQITKKGFIKAVEELARLESSNRTYACLFHGGDLFYVTRALLTGGSASSPQSPPFHFSPPLLAETMALTGSLVFAVLSAALSSFIFGYNIGVINAPRAVVGQWLRDVKCRRAGGEPNVTLNDLWCTSYPENQTSTRMFSDNPELQTLWSLVSSIFALGALLSAVTLTYFVNRFGRRGTLLINNITAVIGSVCMCVSYYADSFELLIIGRVIIGLNAGINSGAPPMYLTEIAPDDLRGAIGTVHQVVCVMGVFISQILGLPQILGGPRGWPFLFGFSLVPAVLQLATLLFCPESPRHLYLNRHEVEQARKALEFFQAPADVEKQMSDMESDYDKSKDLPRVTIVDLFRDRFLRRVIIICMMVMLSQQFSGINAVMFYSTAIFVSSGLSGEDAQYATIGMGGIFVLASIVSMTVVERLGRKVLLLGGLAGMCVMTILLVAFMKLTAAGMAWASYLSVTSVMLFVVFFAIGPGPIPWFIASELFTEGPRAPATSVVAGVNWSSTLLITFAFPLVETSLGEYTFLIFTGCLVGFVVYTILKVPETKGKRIDEIQAEMRQRL